MKRAGTGGFTLMEAMVALSIAGIILVAGVSATMTMNGFIADTRRRTQAWDEAKRLEEYLLSRAQMVGGGALRPSAAVLVENNCAPRAGMPNCGGSDRLTYMLVDTTLPECHVASSNPTHVFVDDDTPGHCCLDAPTSAAFTNRQALLVNDTTGVARSVQLTVPTGAGACGIKADTPGQAAPLLPGPFGDGAPGTLIVVTPVTLYLDRTTRELIEWRDTNGNGTANAGELRLMNDMLEDFQVALGYDSNPEDGEVVDNSNTSDEWRFNVAGDPALGAGVFAATRPDQLRVIEIGIVIATPSLKQNSVQLLDGPTRTSAGRYLVATSGRAFMRNLNLFTQ